jgi:hypothetical protein
MSKIICNRWDVFEELNRVIKDHYIFINPDQASIIYLSDGTQHLYDTCHSVLVKLGIINQAGLIENVKFEDINKYTTYINEKYLNKTY